MRKRNYFGKLVAIAMVFFFFFLSSCDKEDNAIINGQVWVKPEVQLVDGGAIITGSSPADINRMLGRVRQQIIQAAQKGESFTIDIQTSVLNCTTGDNTLNIATVTGGDVVLNLPSNIVAEAPLIIQKQGVADDATAGPSDNKVEINFPAASNLDLGINMPNSTVTLKGGTFNYVAATTAWNTLVIEKGVTVNWLKMLGGRAEVKEGGKVLGYLRDGSEGEKMNSDAYIGAGGVEPIWTNNGWDVFYMDKEKGEVAYCVQDLMIVKGKAAIARVTIGNAAAEDALESITIDDGAAVSLSFNYGYWDDKKQEWVDGDPKGVKLIKGLGNKTAKIYPNSYWSDSHWDSEKEENIKFKGASISLSYVDEISNVTVDATVVPDCYKWDNDQQKEISEGDVEIEGGNIYLSPKSTDCDFIARRNIWGSVFNNEMSKVTNCNLTVQKKLDFLSEQIGTINAVNSKLTAEEFYGMAPNCEGSTFKARYIAFTNYYVSGNASTVKNCKFEAYDKENDANITFPYQTKDRSSFNFGFDTCEFGKGFRFYTRYEGSKPWLDKDGKPVTKAYYWYELNEDGSFKTDDNRNIIQNRSNDEKDIPDANKANGKTDGGGYWDNEKESWVTSNGYWIEQNPNGMTLSAYYKDYKGYLTLTNTTLDGKAITSKTDMIGDVYQGRDEKGEQATKTYYVIDGTTYEALYSSNDKKWILVSVE